MQNDFNIPKIGPCKGQFKFAELSHIFENFPPGEKKDIEAWVVNTVKISMIKKMSSVLEKSGIANLQIVFLVPLFTISDLTYRVNDLAPELRTIYFKELIFTMDKLKSRLYPVTLS